MYHWPPDLAIDPPSCPTPPTLRERFLAGYRRRRHPRPPVPILHLTPDANGDVHVNYDENGVIPAFTVEPGATLRRIVAHGHLGDATSTVTGVRP